MHPAATACPGGEEALLDRYKVAVPMGGTSEEPACEAVIHFIPDVDLAAKNAAEMLHALPAEGHVTVLAVLASSAEFLTVDALEALAARALELGCDDAAIVDPFDSQKSSDVLHGALARPGVHAVVFASPCAQLQRGEFQAEPVEIDQYACTSCHRCQQITGCPAIAFTPPIFRIDRDACAGCDLCVEYCRTNVIYSPRSRMTPEQRSRARYAAANQQ